MILQNDIITPVEANRHSPISAEAKDRVIASVGASRCSPLSINHSDSVSLFLESLQANHVAENTIRAYESDIHRLLAFLQHRSMCELAEIQSGDIELFIRQLTLEDVSASTIRRCRAGLKKFFRFLFENGTIAADPFENATFAENFSDHLTLSTILNIIIYCQRRYETESTGEALRYRRDELMLLFMLIYGIRQYQLPDLKLSAMKKEGEAVLLAVSETLSLKLEGIALNKLFVYLKLRNSKADVIFTEESGKPVSTRSIHSLMIELSYAVRTQINPRTLHHTFLHLQRHPDDASQLLREISKLDEVLP